MFGNVSGIKSFYFIIPNWKVELLLESTCSFILSQYISPSHIPATMSNYFNYCIMTAFFSIKYGIAIKNIQYCFIHITGLNVQLKFSIRFDLVCVDGSWL